MTMTEDHIDAAMLFEDTSLVAFLRLKGHTMYPFICLEDNQRVSFEAQGDRQAIETSIKQYYDNEQVGIQDFVRNLKEVKSAMYNLRRVAKG